MVNMGDNPGIAWVSGASGYWGRKTVMSLLRLNWQVIALSRQEPKDLPDWAIAQHKSLFWQPLDLEAPDWPSALSELPGPQALFHCVGLFDDDFERMLRVNVVQSAQLIDLAAERMQAQQSGRIGIYLGQNGRLGMPGLGAFSATQGALWTWTESRAKALKQERTGVSLSLVFPERAPSHLQGQLAERLNRKIKLTPPETADDLVAGVLKGQPRVGRKPWLAGLSTLLT
ncbi:SDR family NAD(P)-dependent oxidoreductase [Vampirovibrio sp.]|uniref:SDR family NAD(P)-dependent oxidoreductase n=1 Tax=Vampirovibrio sp. TaxID=2717857 RepID=UPI00359463E3